MKTKSPLSKIAALLVVAASAVPAIATEPGVIGRTFSTTQGEVDPAIPEIYRRSFSTSRNEVVMVFEQTHWRSLTKRAAKGSFEQQLEFCQHLTSSDRSTGKIPYGFRYETNGDGR